MTFVDWIILFVVLLYTIVGFRRGLIAAVASAAGSIVCLIAGLWCAFRFKTVLGELLAPHLVSYVKESLPELDTYSHSADQLWNSLSGYLQHIISGNGISVDLLQTSPNPGDMLAQAIAKAVGEEIAYLSVFFVVFILLRIVISMLLHVLDAVTDLPVLHSVNALLGGVVGMITGVLLCTVILWAIKIVIPSAYSDAGMLPPSMMSESAIARRLVGWNDGVSLFETAP